MTVFIASTPWATGQRKLTSYEQAYCWLHLQGDTDKCLQGVSILEAPLDWCYRLDLSDERGVVLKVI